MYLRALLFLCLFLSAHASDPSCKTGILSGSSCCPAICGRCGGPNCGLRTRQTNTTCCISVIQTSSRKCHTTSPPCKITTRSTRADTPDPKCENGILRRGVCCPTECSICGGMGCRKIGRLIGSDCCAGAIRRRNRSCVSNGAPCVMRQRRRMGKMVDAHQQNSLVKKKITPAMPVEVQDKSAVTTITPRPSICATKIRRIAGCFCHIVLKRVVNIRKRFLFVRHCVDTFGKKSILDMAKKCDMYVYGSTAEMHISNLVHEVNLLIPKCYPPMTPLVSFKPVPYVYRR